MYKLKYKVPYRPFFSNEVFTIMCRDLETALSTATEFMWFGYEIICIRKV